MVLGVALSCFGLQAHADTAVETYRTACLDVIDRGDVVPLGAREVGQFQLLRWFGPPEGKAVRCVVSFSDTFVRPDDQRSLEMSERRQVAQGIQVQASAMLDQMLKRDFFVCFDNNPAVGLDILVMREREAGVRTVAYVWVDPQTPISALVSHSDRDDDPNAITCETETS
ncbi:MAG: hypothetical protein AB8B51_16875 [Sedimentitalea sp.]